MPVVTCSPMRSSVEDAGKDLHLVGLAALRREARLAGTAAVELALDVGMRSAAIPAEQPSTTQPIAAPWLSPKVVTRNRWPKLLWDMGLRLRFWLARVRPRVKPRCAKMTSHALRSCMQDVGA